MFIAHFGVGLAAKRVAPKISLGTLFIAVQFLDLVWPTLLLLNVEQVVIHPEFKNNRVLEFSNYPYTHSLLFALGWLVLFGGIYYLLKREKRNAIILGLAVLSHWVLDLIVHFHDLPLFPGNSSYVGLGVWNSILATSVLEAVFFITGVILYLRSVTFKNNTGRVVFWILMIFLVTVHIWSVFAPPPATVKELAWSAQFQWIFVILAYWADRNTSV